MALLGIDLGTSSVKVVVQDIQGHTLSVSKADYAVTAPQPGWSESNPAEWWSATIAAVQAALARLSHIEITAIGLSGQMHGVVLADEGGQPVRVAMLWSDTRAQAELEQYHSLPTFLKERLANPLVPGMAGPMLCWLAKHEASSYQKARWALQPKDWLRFCLTDEVATDPSDASATLLYDLRADSWADDIIAALGLNRSLFPAIVPSGAVAGRLSARAAKALGLPAELPVATGAADTAAAALGTGLLTPGPIQLTLGTGAQLMQLSAEPSADPRGRTHLYRAADGTHWYAMAAVQNAGLVLNWVRQMFNASWDELYASAASVPPGAEGLLFLPYLTKERPHHTHSASSGAFLGMRIDHRREHLLHAVLEGIAFGIRGAFEALPAATKTSTLRLAGGGSEHPAWRQMLANILNRELLSVDTPAASVRGAALLAGIAGGIWANAQETASLAPRTSLMASPAQEQVAVYNCIYARYLENINN
ncbi:xylulokinase [Ktedonosporobacter rubrisoli]|uniref:Xylulose kinase n=1 Tax=Ktedonosporobacter rubrisoli TaxID=2509675 RepID=A0A4P6JNF5_KTERU|nr:xylulokinase [Ktedonosporobacter rubrisoli]QBD76838.1 xylulokinase [Ktedonosporobacter rubrisoli]